MWPPKCLPSFTVLAANCFGLVCVCLLSLVKLIRSREIISSAPAIANPIPTLGCVPVDPNASLKQNWQMVEAAREQSDYLPWQRQSAGGYAIKRGSDWSFFPFFFVEEQCSADTMISKNRRLSFPMKFALCQVTATMLTTGCLHTLLLFREEPDDPERMVLFDDVSPFLVHMDTRDSQV